MKKNYIFLGCLLQIIFTSCKKDEFMHNDDNVNDTVAMISHYVREEYYLYDNANLYLDATTQGALSYQWLPTNETSAVIEFVPNDYKPHPWDMFDFNFFGGYEVIVTLPDTTVTYGIAVISDESVVYCPNSFTPAGDGLNDLWGAFYNHNALTINSLNIYNSRDKRVFHSGENEEPLWDGRYDGDPCDIGYYYYTIHYTNIHGKKKSKEGILQLSR